MKFSIIIAFVVFLFNQSNAQHQNIQLVSNDSILLPNKDTYPILKWEFDTFDIGDIHPGDVLEFELGFENVGKADLEIEVATACKCIHMDWPREVVPPGYQSKILVVFDSKGIELGKHMKTIDIVSNTNPIVVEGFVKMNIIPKPE